MLLRRTQFDLKGFDCKMERVVVHWTAGKYSPNSVDLSHYHALIRGDAKIVPGIKTVCQNARPITGDYAAHTWNCNTGSVGISLCAMRGANLSTGDLGLYPVKKEQWDKLILLLADLSDLFKLGAPTRKNMLFHSEVQGFLGIPQKAKVDIDVLPWDTSLKKPAIGDLMRSAVAALLVDEVSMGDKLVLEFQPSSTRVEGVAQNCDFYFKAREVEAASGWKIVNATGSHLDMLSQGHQAKYEIINHKGSGYMSLKDIKDFASRLPVVSYRVV